MSSILNDKDLILVDGNDVISLVNDQVFPERDFVAEEKIQAVKKYLTDKKGRIIISSKNASALTIRYTLLTLVALTVLAFFTFDYKKLDVMQAIIDTFVNIGTAFFSPKLTYLTFFEAMHQIAITFAMAILATIFGAFISFFCSLMCASNIANPRTAHLIKSFSSFIRAVPTILWVFIFAVSAGLGSVAAVVGLTFHSVSYLIKAYSESIEEIDFGTIEALRASGASYWQIVFQAIVPSCITYMIAWTFMRFEINFANAVAMGAAAGAGGIGYNLYMTGNFYFDLQETGCITLLIVATIVLLEMVSTYLKERVR